MTPTEILHKIVETENEARTIYDEAVALENGFDESVRAHVDKLRDKYAAKEEAEVAAAESAAVSQADEEIRRLDQKLETELNAAKTRYEAQRGEFAEKLFRLAVSLDA